MVWYTSVDLPVAEKIAKAFEAKYPGVAVRVERSGAERIFQRIGQEYGSNIHAVDVVNSSDAAHFIVWKKQGHAGGLRARGRRQVLPGRAQGPGRHCSPAAASGCASSRYNTKLVKTEEAPKSFADLLDPKWNGKIVKAHPGYSGTIMTATYPDAARSRLGATSRSSRSRRSCRCSHRPIRRRSWRSASAR